MAGANCFNCIYSVCNPELWLRWVYMGMSIVPQCANHPWSPGQLREVTGTPCRNYRRKPEAPGGDVRLIPLAEGSYVYVDAADYEWLSQWKWYTTSGGYAARRENNKTVFMHRMIMQPRQGMIVDHVDGSKANNCRFNLRVCTPQENLRNLRKRNGARSQFKGVGYDKRRRRFYAHCWFLDKNHWLGYFENESDAARAYDYAAVGAFGEFARLNFPQEWPPERRAQIRAQWLEARKKERKNARKGKSKKVKGKEAKGKRAKPRGRTAHGTRRGR